MLDVRKQFRQEHIKFLETNREVIKLAGGLRYNFDQDFVGGSWVVKAACKERVVELIESDPYYSRDHRHYEVFYWGLVTEQMRDRIVA